jgi:hypothetical protein
MSRIIRDGLPSATELEVPFTDFIVTTLLVLLKVARHRRRDCARPDISDPCFSLPIHIYDAQMWLAIDGLHH